MDKRRMKITLFLVFFCLCLLPLNASAKSTTDATEAILTEKECSLTVSCACDGMAFSDVNVNLYKIADVSSDFQYTPTSSFVDCGLSLNGIKTTSEWNVIKTTVESFIVANRIKADKAGSTNGEGIGTFEKLPTGLYLASFSEAVNGDVKCRFQSALVSLPTLNSNNLWQYEIELNPKAELVPPTETEKSYKIVKLWKGDEGNIKRPVSVEVEIFKNGISYKTVSLSENNNWSYSWTAKDDGTEWTVIERNIPSGYTSTVYKRETSFVLTNTFISDDYSESPPSTGDTSNVMFYAVIMILSGCVLIFLGAIGKKRSK
jgi:hypothetical protein